MASSPENSPNSALPQFKDLKKVERIPYGDTSKPKPDIILLCPHDGDHKDFLKIFLQLQDHWPEDISIDDYMNLERDHASEMITDQLLKNLTKERPDLRIDVLKVGKIPRGVIDVNRKPAQDMNGEEFAIRYCFDHAKFPELYNIFQEIHLAIITQIREAIADLAEGGIFIDIHTMNDYCPTNPITLSPNTIKEYYDSLTDPRLVQQVNRSVNALTTTSDGRFLANQLLASELEKAFLAAGYKFDYDKPYWLIDQTMSTDLLERYPGRGIAIDYPLHVLHDGSFDNVNPKIVQEKLEQVAALTSKAILASIN